MGAQNTRDLVAEKIVAVLLLEQRRGLERDTGHGYMTAREIAPKVGLTTDTTRQKLRELAIKGAIREAQMSNGLYWRTVNPLPWEPGGKWPGEAEREAKALRAREAQLIAELAEIRARLTPTPSSYEGGAQAEGVA